MSTQYWCAKGEAATLEESILASVELWVIHITVTLQRLEAGQEGRRSVVGGRRSSSTFLHSHLAMIPADCKSGSVLLLGASTPALQVSTLSRDLTGTKAACGL